MLNRKKKKKDTAQRYIHFVLKTNVSTLRVNDILSILAHHLIQDKTRLCSTNNAMKFMPFQTSFILLCHLVLLS